MNNGLVNIFGIDIQKLDENSLINIIQNAISSKQQKTICYVNSNTINLINNNNKLKEHLLKFDHLHPDGIGVYLASKLLYGKNGFEKRITGSDFYSHLIEYSKKNNWSFFFFGDTDDTLERISKLHPEIKLAGTCNGFNFKTDEVILKINSLNPDILIVGLGSQKQEKWIIENKESISTKVIIAVGEGIRVFAGNKKRGPKIIQKLGLEWLVRLFFEPKRLWKRYLIGNPLFIIRVLKFKFQKKEK